METKTAIFKLYANCLLQSGYRSYIICDLQRQRVKHIPGTLFFILKNYKNRSVEEIKNAFNHEHDAVIEEYFQFLHENEFGFYCTKEELKLFPALDLSFDYPSHISNAIIDLTPDSRLDLPVVFSRLEELLCYHVQLRFTGSWRTRHIRKSLSFLKNHTDSSVELILPWHSAMTSNSLFMIYSEFPVSQIHLYNVPEHKADELKAAAEGHKISIHRGNIITEHSPRDISKLQANIILYSESQKYHTYFNRKLYIGENGEIKNAPECEDVHGRISDPGGLKEIISGKDFQKYWHVHKGLIDVCRDCEFRNLCIDNRVPKRRKELEWYHETECPYNPYIARWENEAGYSTLSECGISSNGDGFKINHTVLKKISAVL